VHDYRVARRYAQALFGSALQHDIVRAVEEDLKAIVGMLVADGEFRDFILAPYTSREEKAQITDKLFSDRVTALTMQVLRIILEKRRETELEAIFDEYVRLRRSHEGIVYATVTSATVLDREQQDAIVAKVETVLGKKVEPEFLTDSALIGGVKVAYDNFVLDGTAKGALNKLRDKLRYDLLKQQP
jgi:F-type H+-transporting ATPase subunit delta